MALVARREDRLHTVADAIVAAGGRAFALPADLNDARAPWDVVEACSRRMAGST